MAGPVYNIPQLFQKYFNLVGNYIPYHGVAYTQLPGETDSPFTPASYLDNPNEVNKSYFGVPIYEQISLSAPANGGLALDYSFPGWPLMELNVPTRIVKSDVTDHPGSIKEYMGDGDVEITIRGFLINHAANDIPLADMKALYQVRQQKQALKVTSNLLNSLGIHYLVIENLSFPEVEAAITMQPFVIDALSDYPYELVIRDAVNSKVLTPQQLARQILLGK
jgi:hypothetical protein